jgi:hypothetical protein
MKVVVLPELSLPTLTLAAVLLQEAGEAGVDLRSI